MTDVECSLIIIVIIAVLFFLLLFLSFFFLSCMLHADSRAEYDYICTRLLWSKLLFTFALIFSNRHAFVIFLFVVVRHSQLRKGHGTFPWKRGKQGWELILWDRGQNTSDFS